MYRPRTRAGPEDRGWGCAVPSTVLLLFAYLAYLALGTGVFWTLEGRAAQESSRSFQRDKWELLQNFTCLDRPALDSLIRDVVQAYKNGASLLSNTTGMGRWELLGSFFFSVSTITTIGYGNLSPNTMAARLFCIFFALVGIPLNLVVLNRLGHLMQQGVNHCSSRLGGTWQDPGKARWLAGSGALLSGLLLFLLLPPLLFSHMEGWSYMEGFYFAFITLSTVGFGDYVIGESSWRWAGRDIWLPTPLTHLLPQLAHLLCARHVGAFRPKIRRHCPTRLCCVTGLRSLRPFVTNAERSDRSAGPPVVLRRPHMTGVPASLPGPCLPQALSSPLHSLPRERQSVPLLLDWRPQYPRIRQ
ncbi:potassium channel subfamily K member 17 isoform X1 [Macaca nemestrina]|uniref:potassium channel subfamily K member 17 isoform X1 n=1 Tax=Macaca nemestrina TaxID=9545 RepID=UPI0039B8BC3B